MSSEEEPLIEGAGDLAPQAFSPPAPRGELYARVRARTMASLRRRRILRRAGRLGALAVTYSLGLLTAHAFLGPTERPPSPPMPPRERTESETPQQLERRARFAGDARRVELLERAGDLYLTEWGDVAAALRCYREVLRADRNLSRLADRRPSWLLAALTEDLKPGDKR